jgi:hypothetical protein
MRWHNRFTVAAAALAVALLGSASPAAAGRLGGITVTPAKSIDTAPIRVRTSAGCPVRADNYYAVARGHGFPPAGQIVTTPTAAGLSHRDGFDVYFGQTMKDFAADNHTTLTGRYDVTVYCTDSFTRTSFGEFTGSLTFSTPTRYVSAGGAAATARPAPATAATLDPALAPTPSPAFAPTVVPEEPPVSRAAAPGSGRGSTPLVWVVIAVIAAALIAFEAGRRLGHSQRS